MKKVYNTPLVEEMSMTSFATICTTSPGGGSEDPVPGFEIVEGSVSVAGE